MKRLASIFCGIAALLGAETMPFGAAEAQIVSLPFTGTISVQRKSIVDLRFNQIERQRFDLSCGAAAVATLLTYFYGDKVEEKFVIEEALKSGDKEKIEKQGFSMLELKRFGDRRGYSVQGFKITKPEAISEIKIPFLTLVSSRGYDHFVIVKGVKDGIVYIADPAFGNRSIPQSDFLPEWSKVILVYLSKTKKPNNQFALESGVRAPIANGQMVQLLDRYLTHIQPNSNGF